MFPLSNASNFRRQKTSYERSEMRANFEFCADMSKTTAILKLLQERIGTRVIVFKWYQRFKEGRQNIEDLERRSR